MKRKNHPFKVVTLFCVAYMGFMVSCRNGGSQPPRERMVTFEPPANLYKIGEETNQRSANFDMILKIVTSNAQQQLIVYPGSPIFTPYSTVPPNSPIHPTSISIPIDQPEGATAYVIDLSMNMTECGRDISRIHNPPNNIVPLQRVTWHHLL